MNSEDRKLLGRLEEKIEGIRENLTLVRSQIEWLVKGHQEQDREIAVIKNSFSNHLAHHARDFKMFTTGMSALTAFVGVVFTLVKLGVI